MSAVCEVYGPYHTFDVPTDDYGRRCACGVPQVYRPPTGKAVEFSDVIVDAEDLRTLITGYLDQAAMPDEGMEELCTRLKMLLD